MNDFEMMNMFGLGLMPPFTFQFHRYPPGINPPTPISKPIQLKRNSINENVSLNPKLNDYQIMYREYASSLFNMTSRIIPPSHPLYLRDNSIITLQDANSKLQKENYELKKQLDDLIKKSSTSSTV